MLYWKHSMEMNKTKSKTYAGKEYMRSVESFAECVARTTSGRRPYCASKVAEYIRKSPIFALF